MYACQQNLGINAGIIKMVCEKINNCKTGISKNDGFSYKFEYVDKEMIPKECVKRKSSDFFVRLTDEDKKLHKKESFKKWQKKVYVCPKCDKTLKNSSKYLHNKKCELISG